MSSRWFTMLKTSSPKILNSQKLFFSNNCTQVQVMTLKSSFSVPNTILSKYSIRDVKPISKLPFTRSFSSTSLMKSTWNNLENNTSRYLRLNRFQQYQHRDNGKNSLGRVTIFALSVMVGVYFGSPYLFKYVPPFDHFRRHPSELVYAILGLNILVFGLWQLPRYFGFLQKFMLLEKRNIYSKWSLIGSAFSHQEAWHLGMNMLALWSFGTSLASILGASNFFTLYINSALAGSLFSLWYPKIARIALIGPSLGASGALFGVFGCFSYLFPTAKILLFVFPIPGGAWVAFLASIAWNTAGCAFRWGSFDYAAHLGGSALGIAYGWYISNVAKKQKQQKIKRSTRWM